jgi:hypothetical protein
MLRLGRDTGSLTNYLMSGRQNIEPTVCMGVTILMWTDRHAGTITDISGPYANRVLSIREDTATRIDTNGMSESQTYSYEPNPNGRLWTFKQNRAGRWCECVRNLKTGRWNICAGGGSGLRLDDRDAYYDYSF